MIHNYEHLHEKITAGKLLSISAAQISSRLDLFCSWLLIGVGGAYALILANLKSLQDLISVHYMKGSLLMLLVAIVLGILQRWLAAVVAGNAATSEMAGQIGKDLSERDIDIDFTKVFSEMEKGLFYPTKWIARSSFKKAMSGDFAASGRFSAFISQVQSWLVFTLVGVIVAAIAVTISGVK